MVSNQHLMRATAHLNIGATLATAAWLLWSGFAVVTHERAPLPLPRHDGQTGGVDCPCRREPRGLMVDATTRTLVARSAAAYGAAL